MLAILIDSRLGLDERTLLDISRAEGVDCAVFHSPGWESESEGRCESAHEVIKQFRRAHGHGEADLAVFWSAADRELIECFEDLAEDGDFPKRLFLCLGHCSDPSKPAGGATIDEAAKAWGKAIGISTRSTNILQEYRLLITFAGEEDFHGVPIGEEVRQRTLGSLVLVLRRGGGATFQALIERFGQNHPDAPIRVFGLRSWMPSLGEIKRSLVARLARALYGEFHRQQRGNSGELMAGRARSEVSDLRQQLLSVFEGAERWPSQVQLFLRDWRAPVWKGDFDGEVRLYLSDMAGRLAKHAAGLRDQLGGIAAKIRLLSFKVLDETVTRNREFLESNAHLAGLAGVLLDYFPVFSEIGKELPKGAERPFSPASRPSAAEVSGRVRDRLAVERARQHAAGLLGAGDVVGFLIGLIAAAGISYGLIRSGVSEWFWLCLPPAIWLLALTIRIWIFVRARRSIEECLAAHIDSVQEWLLGCYADKADRVRENARRLTVYQFVVRQRALGERLGSLLRTLVGDWRRMLREERGPHVPDLGIEDDKVFRQAEESLRTELERTPEQFLKFALDPETLGREAGLLDRIVRRQLARMFEAHTQAVVPLEKVERAVGDEIDAPLRPEPLAPIDAGLLRREIGKILVVPNRRDYREMGDRIATSRPAVGPFDLTLSEAAVWAPTIVLFGPAIPSSQVQTKKKP